MHQIPNFIIAAPILLLCFVSLFLYYREYLRILLNKSNNLSLFSRNAHKLLPYMLHWNILFCIAVIILHIQVTTRFMSATPPVYWFLSFAIHSSKGKRFSLFFNHTFLPFVTIGYCLLYIVLGSILHTNFYPWT